MGTNLQKMQSTLNDATTRDLNKTLKDLDGQMESFSDNVTDFSGKLDGVMSQKAKDAIKENAEDVDRVSTEIKEANEAQEKVKEEFDPEDEPIE